MTIHAIALLRLPQASVSPAGQARVTPLEDAILLHTGEPFATEPEELSVSVHALVGDAISTEHRDPRGIFFIPDVAAPRATTYDAVIAEVGEGGMWGPLVDTFDTPDGSGDFQALLGNLLGQMPSSLLAAATAAAQGEPSALSSMTNQIQGMLGSSPQLQELAAQLSGMLNVPGPGVGPAPAPPDAGSPQEQLARMAQMLGDSGIDMSAPALQAFAAKMQNELATDPSDIAKFAERFLGKDMPDKGGDKK